MISYTSEKPDLRFQYIDFMGMAYGMLRINTDEVTFDELWNEICTYNYTISYACDAYFADDYEGNSGLSLSYRGHENSLSRST